MPGASQVSWIDRPDSAVSTEYLGLSAPAGVETGRSRRRLPRAHLPVRLLSLLYSSPPPLRSSSRPATPPSPSSSPTRLREWAARLELETLTNKRTMEQLVRRAEECRDSLSTQHAEWRRSARRVRLQLQQAAESASNSQRDQRGSRAIHQLHQAVADLAGDQRALTSQHRQLATEIAAKLTELASSVADALRKAGPSTNRHDAATATLTQQLKQHVSRQTHQVLEQMEQLIDRLDQRVSRAVALRSGPSLRLVDPRDVQQLAANMQVLYDSNVHLHRAIESAARTGLGSLAPLRWTDTLRQVEEAFHQHFGSQQQQHELQYSWLCQQTRQALARLQALETSQQQVITTLEMVTNTNRQIMEQLAQTPTSVPVLAPTARQPWCRAPRTPTARRTGVTKPAQTRSRLNQQTAGAVLARTDPAAAPLRGRTASALLTPPRSTHRHTRTRGLRPVPEEPGEDEPSSQQADAAPLSVRESARGPAVLLLPPLVETYRSSFVSPFLVREPPLP